MIVAPGASMSRLFHIWNRLRDAKEAAHLLPDSGAQPGRARA